MWLRNETKRLYGMAAQGLALDFGGEGGARTLWLLPASDPALAPPDADADRRWFAADLAHGLPRLPEGQREAWTPQMLICTATAA